MSTFGPGAESAPRTLTVPQRVLTVLFILAAVLLVQLAATQHVANQLGHPAAFAGQRLAGELYVPWAWFGPWRDPVIAQYPGVYLGARAIALTGTAGIAVVLALFGLRRRRREGGDDSLHGTAHWASAAEIRRTGLLPPARRLPLRPPFVDHPPSPEGLFVGAWKDGRQLHYLRHSGPEHVLAFAPTRSGKGVGLVVPTLLTWPHSALVHDPKGEAWALTAGWRAHAGGRVVKFDPCAPDSARFNPLGAIRLGLEHEVADAQNIATMIADPEGKGLRDHWSKTAQALLTGLILHVRYRPPDGREGSLADVAAALSNPDTPARDFLETLLETPHLDDGTTHPVVAQEARAALNKDERELGSVISTAVSYLSLYRDPIAAANTSTSDFAIEDLMHGRAPMSLYLVVRPADQARTRPLVRLILTQIVTRLMERMDFRDGRSTAHYDHRLLLMLDEFASLQRLPAVQEGLAVMAGYGLTAYLIVQDLAQLDAAYGPNASIVSNCHVRVAYAPNELKTADLLSRMTGRTTVVHTKRSRSGSDTSMSHVSESLQETGRALLMPDEVMRLPGPRKTPAGDIVEGGAMLVFVAGHAPIYGAQVLYFKDPILSRRAKVRPPHA